jgi:uncharacterized protein
MKTHPRPARPGKARISLIKTEEKTAKLTSLLKSYGKTAIAFSGGVDSTFLLGIAHEVLGDDIIAVTVSAPFMSSRELQEAKEIAGRFNVRQEIAEVDMDDIDGFVDNPPDRCYHCKKYLFTKMKEIASKTGFETIIDATNADDIDDYRPGMKALAELGIISPLREAGLTKEEIRGLSKERRYSNWSKPSSACLASRIPYGDRITRDKLEKIEKAEAFLASMDFRMCRVRVHGDIARIEVAPGGIEYLAQELNRRKVVEHLKALGFRYITLDLTGYRTGSLNESLDI